MKHHMPCKFVLIICVLHSAQATTTTATEIESPSLGFDASTQWLLN
jgi:hypothetical protein